MLRWKQIQEDFCQSRLQKPIYSKSLRAGQWEITTCRKLKPWAKKGDWSILSRIITCQMEARSIISESLEPNFNLSTPLLILRSSGPCPSTWERHQLDLTLPCKLQTTSRTFRLLIMVLMDWRLLRRKKQCLKVAQILWTLLTSMRPISTHLINKKYS